MCQYVGTCMCMFMFSPSNAQIHLSPTPASPAEAGSLVHSSVLECPVHNKQDGWKKFTKGTWGRQGKKLF